ncbi:WD40/YVTN/BNR-like repeat-containing protein [Paraburkholderia ribeironis]|nr:hypothetical protein [Paraburkholderia ribeironis]
MVNDIAIDPSGSSDSTIYVATDAGGVWKTTDGGQSWFAKTDSMPSLVMAAVALDPTNPQNVFAATGNYVDQGGLPNSAPQSFYATGLYKSTNGGDSWSVLNPTTRTPAGDLTGQGISRLALPDSNTLLVGAQQGVYRMASDGTNVTVPLTGIVTDLKVDTSTPGVVYAAIANGGIYRSSDKGATFAATPFFSAASRGVPTGLTFGGIYFTQSSQPDSGKTFYVAAVITAGTPSYYCGGTYPPQFLVSPSIGLYKSSDGGKNWNEILQGPEVIASLQPVLGTLAYDIALGVDPQDSTSFYYGLRGLFHATDGGSSGLRDKKNQLPGNTCLATQDNRIDEGQAHADYHAIQFSPPSHRSGTPTIVYLGSDGGFVKSSDGGKTFSTLNDGLATVLLTGFDMAHDSRPNDFLFSYGVAQDNGLFAHSPEQPLFSWRQATDSDGITVAVDPLDGKHALGTTTNGQGRIYVTSDGASWTPGNPLSGNASPIVFDPNGRNVYAAVGTSLFRSTDNGGNFTVIGTFSASIQAIAVAASNPSIVWVGLNDGTLQLTNTALNQTPSWNAAVSQPAAQGRVTAVAIDPDDSQSVVATYPGFSRVTATVNPSRHVFWTANGGSIWTDISGSTNGGSSNLPDLPLFAVVIDPGTHPHTLIVAGTGGVFQYQIPIGKWEKVGNGLPNVEFKALGLNSNVNPEILRVASWGRSVFEISLPKPREALINGPTDRVAAERASNFPDDEATRS